MTIALVGRSSKKLWHKGSLYMLTPNSQVHDRTLRSSVDGTLMVPRSRTSLYDKSSSFSAPKYWNSLPTYILTYISCSSDFDINLCSKMCFSAAEIAEGVNHVIVIDPEVSLGTHYDQVTLTYLSCSSDFVINLCSKMCFSATEIAVSVKHVIVIDPEVP